MSGLNEGRLTPIPLSGSVAWPPVLRIIGAILESFDVPVYLVGGAIRDAVLHRESHDLDLVTGPESLSVARAIANRFRGAFFILDEERGTGRALIEFEGVAYEVDVSRFRGESLASDLGERDFTINALAARLGAEGPSDGIIDPLGGLVDLKAKRLRHCAPASIQEDPLRVLRAVRIANALHLIMEPETRADLKAAIDRLPRVSIERRRDEFMRILEGPRPAAALRVLDTLGILPQLIPEVVPMHGVTQRPPHQYDVWEHTLKTVEALDKVLTIISPARTSETAADGNYGMIVYRLDRYRQQLQAHMAQRWPNGRSHRGLLILAALLHDCGKPGTRSVDAAGVVHFYGHEDVGAGLAAERAEALRLSNDEAARLSAIVRGHMRPMHLGQAQASATRSAEGSSAEGSGNPGNIGEQKLSRRAVYRYWDALDVAGIDVAILTQADYLAVYGVTIQLRGWLAHLEVVAQLLEAYYFQRTEVVSPAPLLNGTDLMRDYGLGAGPLIGALLRKLNEAQASGEVTTIEEARAFIQSALNDPALSGPLDE